MRRFLFSASLAALSAAAAQGAPPADQVIYNVDDARVCSQAPADRLQLKQSLLACDTAINDPVMIRRATLLMDRGVIRAKLGDDAGALRDYDAAIAINARLGEAYVGRAGVLAEMKRYDEARGDIATAMSLGASNLYAAFYTRGAIAEERGDVQSAYRDYKQALALNPDYLPAARELARFRLVPQGAGL
jgi:tetratricopeptide (TPR) repeat protein